MVPAIVNEADLREACEKAVEELASCGVEMSWREFADNVDFWCQFFIDADRSKYVNSDGSFTGKSPLEISVQMAYANLTK